MRTTLALESDAVDVIQEHARLYDVSLGKAASELIRRGKNYELGITWKNGLPVVNVPDNFGTLSAERVKQLLDEE